MKKPWYKSMTVISAIAFSAIQAAEQNQVVPAGVTQNLADVLQNVLLILGAYGVRRAIG